MTVGKLVGWNYQKKITLNNTGAELTDYQVMFTVNRSAGTDTGFTVYVGTKCESDYDDIRFTKADGTTLLDYWIESADSNTALIWVEVDTIAASGNTTIYLYYGNSGASAVSNGDNTLLFFDDFTGTALDTSKWSATLIPYNSGTGTIVISGGQLTLTQTGGAARGVSMRSAAALASDGYTIRYKVDARSAGASHGQLRVILSDSTSADPGIFGTYFLQIVNTVYLHYGYGVGNPSAAETFSTSTPAVWECQCRVSNPTLKKDGTTKCTGSGTPSAPPGNYLRIWVYDTNNQTKFDWILVRKYAATEPTVSAWGPEDTGSFGGVGMGSANCMGIGM